MKDDEHARLAAVKRFSRIEFSKSPEFQSIVDLAAELCEKPVAIIGLLDDSSNHLKVYCGISEMGPMPAATSFCRHAVAQSELMVVNNTLEDERFVNNPLVTDGPRIRFYAGAPLTLRSGLRVGTLCLFDTQPGELTLPQQKIMPVLAAQVTSLMELEISQLELRDQNEETEARNQALMRIAQLQSHQIRRPLTSITGLVNLVKTGVTKVDQDWINMFEQATGEFDDIIHKIVKESSLSKDLKVIRFNRMVEEIDDYAILLLDRDGVIENWNRGAQKIKGYTSSEIIGRHFSIFYPDDDQRKQRATELMSLAIETGTARDCGWRVRKNGTKFWGSVVITAIHNDDDEVIGFTKVTRDLSDIKKMEMSLANSSELNNVIMEQTLKAVNIGGWEVDLVSNTIFWTAITREIHEAPDDYIPELETAINFYKEGESRRRITDVIRVAIQEGKPFDIELDMITYTGKQIRVRSTGSPNFYEGVCTKLYGTFQRIS